MLVVNKPGEGETSAISSVRTSKRLEMWKDFHIEVGIWSLKITVMELHLKNLIFILGLISVVGEFHSIASENTNHKRKKKNLKQNKNVVIK